MAKQLIQIGDRFSKLTVIAQAEPYVAPTGYKIEKWLCRCDCGNEKTVMKGHLLSGATTSCGCVHSNNLSRRNTTHGQADTKLYGIYRGIKARCYNANHGDYQHYGQKGITMCDEWLNDFQAFRYWAYANGYKDEILPNGRSKWTIDRIDSNGNYVPSNCRWITIQAQQNNKTRNYRIEYNGKTQTIAEWARELGIRYNTLHNRILRYGWSIERALTV